MRKDKFIIVVVVDTTAEKSSRRKWKYRFFAKIEFLAENQFFGNNFTRNRRIGLFPPNAAGDFDLKTLSRPLYKKPSIGKRVFGI